MKKLLSLTGLLTLFISCSDGEPSKVMVVPTIHGAHERNTNYTYEDLFALIRKYDPDVIGIEIRPEDMQENNDYLDPFYPAEMMMVKDSFPDKVVGLDFYGESVRGKLMDPDKITDTTTELGRFIQVQREMASDSILQEQYRKTDIPKLAEEQRRMALNYSVNEFMKGEYDSITERYYRILDSLLKNTAYEQGFTELNTQRDVEITRNSLKLVRNNPGEKVLILVGANHRSRLVDSLETMENVELTGPQAE